MPGQQRVQKFTPQDFFPRSGINNKSKGFIFNTAPINKVKAKEDTETIVKTNKNKRSAFLSKIYQDDDEDMKVFNMGSDDDGDQQAKTNDGSAPNKRAQKELEKSKSGTQRISKSANPFSSGSKIARLKFTQGSLGLFAVSEIHSNYVIVNYTRNVKGYIAIEDSDDLIEQLEVGQLIVAAIISDGTAQYNISTSGAQNKKLQLSLSLESINKTLTAETITPNMFLQGLVASKEAKGFMINFGLKDKTQGFIPFSEGEAKADLTIGQIVQVVVKKVMTGSKIIKCEIINSANKTQHVQQKEDFTHHNVKPGFLVSAKISKLLENGLEVGFLGGIMGTIFIDHIGKDSITSFKVGEKVSARVIASDPSTKVISLSLLPHIVGIENSKDILFHNGVSVGKLYEKVKVKRVVFGSSYEVRLDKNSTGFLHKIHISAVQNKKEEEEESDEDGKKKRPQQEELKEGQVLDKIRVKEINYFDGKPILSMRKDIVDAQAMDYAALEIGQYVTGKIDEVNEIEKYVVIRINEFVRGKLFIEHMADYPLKVIPPKFKVVGKDIKVRVFGLEPEDRLLEFTKKESLLKSKAPVYKSYKQVSKGNKIVGIIVGENEHGYIIKTYGNIKCLLTHQEIAQNGKGSKKDFKFGNIVKAYVLFKKKDQGMALTLDKVKAKELSKDSQPQTTGLSQVKKTIEQLNKSIEEDYFPSNSDISLIKEKFKSLTKASNDVTNIGRVMTFRFIESQNKFLVVKSIDAAKKSTNIFAILPKCLVSNFGIPLNTEIEDLTFEAIIIEIYNEIPIISCLPELVTMKDEIPKDNSQIDTQGTQKFIGFVSETNRKGVVVRFLAGLKKVILIKDLETASNFQEIYKIGKVVRVGKNKLDRLCLKQRVIYYGDKQLQKQDKTVQIESYYQQFQKNQEISNVKVGEKVEAIVELTKDYGLIVSIASHPNFTGFIMNEHKSDQNKIYKERSRIQCVVLDIDFEKNIIDLSEKLDLIITKAKTSLKLNTSSKANVELSKEDYLVVSLKQQKGVLALCMTQSFNGDESKNPNESFHIGDEINVQTLQLNSNGTFLTLPILEEVKQNESKTDKGTKKSNVASELKEGTQITSIIKSIKGQCAFLQIPYQNQLIIGRLHKIECQSTTEFDSFHVGDKITAKILKVTIDKKKTWVEFTRKKEHMLMPNGLNPELLKSLISSYDDLKSGKQYNALITDVNFQYSQPVQISLSPFVKGQISFFSLISASDLQKQGNQFLEKYKIGDSIKVVYKDDKFLIADQAKISLEKGNLVVVRFVKAIRGRGVTVQVEDNVFGFIEISEITDEVIGNVFGFLSEKLIFTARIIDKNKDGKLMLSSRESVIDPKQWEVIGPEGKSINFQKLDKKRQTQGNQRNKILKFGAEASLHQDDLCIGFVTNIGKSGCFITIGHNTTVRSSLGELSDQSSFNFVEEMPVGRMVIGRITKVDEKDGKKQYNFSLRRSVVVYGVSAVDRTQLAVGQEIEAIVMNVLADKLFAQIKGSYLKLKVKGIQELKTELKEGDHITTKLSKVTKQKITGIYESKVEGEVGLNAEEQVLENIWSSVNEEAQKDIQAIKLLNNHTEIDASMFKQRKVEEDEVEMQMEDLKQLASDDEFAQAEDDSDAEEMQRIIKESKKYEEDDEEDEDEENEDEEEDNEEDSDGEDNEGSDEDEDADMKDDNSEDEDQEMSEEKVEEIDTDEDKVNDNKNAKSGKKSLKHRVQEEQEIRKIEHQLRENVDQPQNIDDFERLLVQNQDQSYVWIQYTAFMLDKLGVESARRVAERAVKSVSISNEEDKFNIWVAYMNLENNFGNQNTLQAIIKRALDVNDRKKIYLQLINIYTSSHKYQYIEEIFKSLTKKYNTSLKIWSSYLDFLFSMRHMKKDSEAVQKFLINDIEFSDPKLILQRSLQSLPQKKHVNIITKFGMLEFKNGNQENGRTMFEGIVNNYPKRMDIWAIYMDMEVKYGGSHNKQQARHLFERCLTNENIMKKPKKMKLVFQKYMEFEMTHGNKKNVEKLRERVEQYLENAFDKEKKVKNESDSE